jgi:hypothetical protein
MKRPYELSSLDLQILEFLSKKDFVTIWEVHSKLDGYDVILVMRAMHNLHAQGYLGQTCNRTETLYHVEPIGKNVQKK